MRHLRQHHFLIFTLSRASLTITERSDVISNEKKKKMSWKSNCKRIRNEETHENKECRLLF